MEITDLLIEFENEFTTQSYASKKKIDGVQIVSIRRFKDDGGSFMEIARFSQGNTEVSGNAITMQDLSNFSIAQLNHAYMQPGTIKAWHIHLNQEDLWFVPPHDRVLVGLYDLRVKSNTYGVEMRFVLGDGEGQVLLIPRGVAHGCANPYEREMQLIYLVNQKFDPNNPDEHRLPYDSMVGKKFWQIQKG